MKRKAHEKPDATIMNASPCHRQVARAYAKLYLVESDGSLTQIGTVCYCPFDDFHEGVRGHCLRPLSVAKSKEHWPADLDVNRLPVLLHDRGPGYYITSGFHIVRLNGGWQNLHDKPTNGLPPAPPEGVDLIPISRAMVEWRRKAGEKPKAPRANPIVKEYKKKSISKPKTVAAAAKLDADLEAVELPPLEDIDGMPLI